MALGLLYCMWCHWVGHCCVTVVSLLRHCVLCCDVLHCVMYYTVYCVVLCVLCVMTRPHARRPRRRARRSTGSVILPELHRILFHFAQ